DAPDTNASLSELAALARMSRYQLIRTFRTATGMTPHAWQLNQRVNLARERIRKGAAIAEVALQLGFADQSEFQRMFKVHTGVTSYGIGACHSPSLQYSSIQGASASAHC